MTGGERGGCAVGRTGAAFEVGRQERLEASPVGERPGLGICLEPERVGEAADGAEPVGQLEEAKETIRSHAGGLLRWA